MSQTKPPYTGDPNATLTICPKKLRRHLPSDLYYLHDGQDEQGEPKLVVTTIPTKDTIGAICKHCKQDPVIPVPAEAASI